MSVYVGLAIADKPRVQHIAELVPDEWDDRRSLCRLYVIPAGEHIKRRAMYLRGSHRKSTATPIDYDRLPICRRCAQKASKA